MHYSRLKEEHLDPAIHIYIYIYIHTHGNNAVKQDYGGIRSCKNYLISYIHSPFYSTHAQCIYRFPILQHTQCMRYILQVTNHLSTLHRLIETTLLYFLSLPSIQTRPMKLEIFLYKYMIVILN